MDIRNVQKTGNMFYMYLPTSWCKEQNVNSSSKLTVDRRGSGKLLISPGITSKQVHHLEIESIVDDVDIINKLVVSCFINPTDSFKIHLGKELNYAELLKQKRIVSVDMVELEGKTIKCESPISMNTPDLLLKTMISKLTNMLMVMTTDYNEELVQRYEEEIDKSRLLIDKAAINAFTYSGPTTLRIITLHYIALISKELERVADHLLNLDKKNIKFFKELITIMQFMKSLIEEILVVTAIFDYRKSIDFATKVNSLKQEEVKDIDSYSRAEVRRSMDSISEVLLDWAITKKVT